MQVTINLRSNDLIAVGDTHDINVFRDIISKAVPDDSDVLHVGDCGIGFSRKDKMRLETLDKLCESKNIKAYIIRGNHDNPFYWSNECDWKFTNIMLVKDYTLMVFPNTKEALCVGGGLSVDRMSRVDGVSYWSNEVTPYSPQYCKKCDYIFMHDAPSCFNVGEDSLRQNFRYYCEHDARLINESRLQRGVIDKIVSLCQPSKILGGHYHNSISETVNDIQYRCLDINEVYTFYA
jgi:predicted phosphohydrolase